jgi:hypothetical protein
LTHSFVTSNDTVSALLIGGLAQRFFTPLASILTLVSLFKCIKQFIALILPVSIHVNLVKKLNERRSRISGGADIVRVDYNSQHYKDAALPIPGS